MRDHTESKRSREENPSELILGDPDFRKSLLQTIANIITGKVNWHKYNEVF